MGFLFLQLLPERRPLDWAAKSSWNLNQKIQSYCLENWEFEAATVAAKWEDTQWKIKNHKEREPWGCTEGPAQVLSWELISVCVCLYTNQGQGKPPKKNWRNIFRVHTGPVPLSTNQNRKPQNSWVSSKILRNVCTSVAGQNKHQTKLCSCRFRPSTQKN